MDISELSKSYDTYEKLQVFCQAQFRQILNLTKKINELEEKNKELQDRMKHNNNKEVVAMSNEANNLITPDFKVLNDAKTIAQVQIKMLKEESFNRELTLEETKKLEIFNRILTEKQEKKEPLKAGAKILDNEDLLALIDGSNGK